MSVVSTNTKLCILQVLHLNKCQQSVQKAVYSSDLTLVGYCCVCTFKSYYNLDAQGNQMRRWEHERLCVCAFMCDTCFMYSFSQVLYVKFCVVGVTYFQMWLLVYKIWWNSKKACFLRHVQILNTAKSSAYTVCLTFSLCNDCLPE